MESGGRAGDGLEGGEDVPPSEPPEPPEEEEPLTLPRRSSRASRPNSRFQGPEWVVEEERPTQTVLHSSSAFSSSCPPGIQGSGSPRSRAFPPPPFSQSGALCPPPPFSPSTPTQTSSSGIERPPGHQGPGAVAPSLASSILPLRTDADQGPSILPLRTDADEFLARVFPDGPPTPQQQPRGGLLGNPNGTYSERLRVQGLLRRQAQADQATTATSASRRYEEDEGEEQPAREQQTPVVASRTAADDDEDLVEGEDEVEEEAQSDDEGYDTNIEERSRPTIPPPDPAAARALDSDGWATIARLGAWSAFLTKFPTLLEVPDQHQEAWTQAVVHVLRKWHNASTEQEINLALMWFLFLPQGLLRRPTRGGRAGRQQVAKRFNSMGRGDWGALIELWEEDKARLNTRGNGRMRRRGGQVNEAAEQLQKRRRGVVSLISSGQISRAMQRVTSHGLASMTDAAIQEQVAAKYLPRGRTLPERVLQTQPVDHLHGLREALQSLEEGSAPGSGGLWPEFLQVLGHKMEEDEMILLEELGMHYLRGDLPHWFYCVWLTVQTVPLFKTSEQSTVRPLGLRNPLLKVFHRLVVRENREEVVTYLEPQQLGMSVGGAQKLVFSARGLLNSRRDFVGVKIDFRNAYNELARRATIDEFQSIPTLRHLAYFCAVTLAPVTGLESGGDLWGEAEEGDTQGDPAASMRFCVGLQSSLVTLDAACSQGGGMARAGADDVIAIGPADVVLPAVEEFAREVQERCLLHWERTKSEVFTWEGDLPPGTPEGLKLAGEVVDGIFEHGFLLYGCPIGSPRYSRKKLHQIASGIAEEAQQTAELLAGERQALWSALRCSISCRFDYWLQMCYPSEVAPVARWLDSRLWVILETATGLSIPQEEEGRGWECVLPVPVEGRDG